MIYSGFKEIQIKFTATITTKSLSQFSLIGYRNEQIQKILKLKKKGLTDQQIADYFNSLNIKTPTGKSYTKQLVLMTRYKYNKRIQRSKEYLVRTTPMIIEIS
ncbi:MAG: hypothetical protein JXQ86_01650 [Methylophilaceae bacterium]